MAHCYAVPELKSLLGNRQNWAGLNGTRRQKVDCLGIKLFVSSSLEQLSFRDFASWIGHFFTRMCLRLKFLRRQACAECSVISVKTIFFSEHGNINVSSIDKMNCMNDFISDRAGTNCNVIKTFETNICLRQIPPKDKAESYFASYFWFSSFFCFFFFQVKKRILGFVRS